MQEIEVNKIYKHFKGDMYLVTDIAINSETQEKWLYINNYMEIV